jgi:hypothetical protein
MSAAIVARGKSPSPSGKILIGPSSITLDDLEVLSSIPTEITVLEKLAAEYRDHERFAEAQLQQSAADNLRKDLEGLRMEVKWDECFQIACW